MLTGLFWTSSSILQRASGFLAMHSGKPYPLTVGWGVLCTGLSLMAAQYNCDPALATLSSMGVLPEWSFFQEKRGRGKSSIWDWEQRMTLRDQDNEEMRKGVLGLASYGMLERRLFRTSLPSSIITTGVYAHTPWHWRFAGARDVVSASSEVATGAQRNAMQVCA